MRNLEIPEGLSDLGRKAAETILKEARRALEGEIYTGGCKAFYTPGEWQDRGEEHGRDSELVVVHDGGDLARFFNYDLQDYPAIDGMAKALREHQVFAENCTQWFTAIYKV
jgi:hypothetical protein